MVTAIDLFAGLGGFTEAARQAGVRVLWAANHWRAAVEIHSANHPEVEHVCQDLHQANWEAAPHMDMILASPACQGHSKARGADKPHHDATRSTAWAVVSCAEYHKPTAIVVENVPEFSQWKLFPAWEAAMRALGYSLSMNVLDAADAGVPQHRRRLFIICTRSRNPFVLPKPAREHVPAVKIIDWNGWKWSPVGREGRSRATLARIEAGRRTFGDRFVMPYYGSGSGLTGRSLNRPLGTVTTRSRWGLVDGDRMRMLQVPEYRRAMGFPESYVLPKQQRLAVHMLGNAVPVGLASYVTSEVRRAA